MASPGSAPYDDAAVPGKAVPAVYRDAVFDGAQMAFDTRPVDIGVRFELINALVHPVDANPGKFKMAGATVLNSWFEWYAQRLSGA
jgi:hypothetical protein